MTNKNNITLTDRQLDILTVGLGLTILNFIERAKRGEAVELGGKQVSIEELAAVQSIVVNKLGEPTAPAGYDVSNLERFVISAAMGALVAASPGDFPKVLLHGILETLDLAAVDRHAAAAELVDVLRAERGQ